MDFFKVIESRHSYRKRFTPEPIPEEDIKKILDAGLRAPSGCNEQTTRFIVVTDAMFRKEISDALPTDMTKTAPVLVLAISRKHTFDFGLDFEIEDYAAAVENILLAATALGYASCWLDGQTRLGKVNVLFSKKLSIEPGEQIRCVLPIGVPEEEGKQAERKAFGERVRFIT